MANKDFTIILPTYNEGGNVGFLIEKLLESYSGSDILVVDDGSKDDTKERVLAFSKNKHVRFMDRASESKEKGLTASVIDGISISKTKYVVVMDADRQHPYKVVGDIMEELEKGNRLVVGVRADVTNWSFYRKVISKSLIVLGYAILSLQGKAKCKDIFSGFFGVERDLFMKTYNNNRSRFIGAGFKVLYDFLKCINKSSIRIGEAPYVFENRSEGKSKAGLKQGLLLLKSFLT